VERVHAQALLGAVQTQGLSPLEQVATQAALLLQAGYPSDALAAVDAAAQAHPDDPALAALVTRIERQVGL
jgi:hypothetical protein